MACCGQRRSMVGTGKSADAARTRPGSTFTLYEYVGTTAMTVTGSISGLKYRFERPGAKVQVDRRDLLSMAGLPNLRRTAG